MSPPIEATILALAALTACAAAPAAPPPAAREIEHYLERHGLTRLLTQRLEERRETAAGQERIDLTRRLAALYAELLEADAPPEQSAELEARAAQLLQSADIGDALDLRLKLLSASYAHAERTAELRRVRLAEEGDARAAAAQLASLADQLNAIGLRAHRHVEELERQEEIVREADADLVARRLAESRRLRSLAMHLAGWANTYAAEFGNNPERAQAALLSFGWLLDASVGSPPTPEKAPAALLKYEHVARSAIGSAVAEAIKGDTDLALRWLDLVGAAAEVPPPIEAEAAARRITVLARAGRWRDLEKWLDQRRGVERAATTSPNARPITPADARLIAVLAAEARPTADPDKRAVAALSAAAIADLLAAGEIGQILDLASRYGAAAVGESPFLANHVRALKDFEEARAASEQAGETGESPTASPPIAGKYRAAADALRAALAAPDAARFAGARGKTSLLLGISLFSSAGVDQPRSAKGEQLADAARWLRDAATQLESADQAADALALSVRALELAIDTLTTGAELDPASQKQIADLRRERATSLAQYVDRFPASDRAGAMRVKSALGESDGERAIRELLAVPETSSASGAARRNAARLAYEAYRAAVRDREWAALRYADIEEPLFQEDRRLAEAGDLDAADRALGSGRRLLDALFAPGAPDPRRAGPVLTHVRRLAELLDRREELAVELLYRSAQLALANQDTAGATRLVAELEAAASASEDPAAAAFAGAAGRVLYRHAERAWRDARRAAAPEDVAVAAAARNAVRYGGRLLLNLAQGEDAAHLDVLDSVTEAAADLWRIEQDRAALDLGLRLVERALLAAPRDAAMLRRAATLNEAAGRFPQALDALRTLSAGLQPGAPEWFDVRLRLYTLLARTDPDRAREAIAQHRVLYPDFGPEPWGPRIRALADSLLGAPPPERAP